MTQPTQIYYDLSVVNNIQPSNTQSQTSQQNRLTFTEVRSSPILDNPSDYFLSIVRFNLDTAGGMPLFVPQIDLQQPIPQPTETSYFVSIEYNNALAPADRLISKQRVIYVPQSNIYLPPTPPLTIEKTTQPYYWLNTFQAFICMINKALEDAYNDVLAQATVASIALPANWTTPPLPIPYLLWDNQRSIATLVAQTPIFEGSCLGGTTPVTTNNGFIYFNTALYQLFSSFQAFHNYTYLPNPPTANDGQANYLIKVFDKKGGTGDNYVVLDATAGPPYNALFMEQTYSTGATLSPIQSLIFTSSLVPVLPQLTSIPRVLSGQNGDSGQNDNLSNEITDLVVNLETGTEYFPSVLYLPTAEYRLIDLQSNSPLYGIQISVAWKDVYGITHDFYLQNGANCSLKILFRKKDQGVY